jgi:hypothetical protein
VAYVGFLLPSVLAAVAELAPYAVLLGGVALVTLACTGVVVASSRRHLPA